MNDIKTIEMLGEEWNATRPHDVEGDNLTTLAEVLQKWEARADRFKGLLIYEDSSMTNEKLLEKLNAIVKEMVINKFNDEYEKRK